MFESSLGPGVQQGGIWRLWTIEFIIFWSHVIMAQTYYFHPFISSSLLSITVRTLLPKQLEKKWFLWFICSGTAEETMEGHCLVTCSAKTNSDHVPISGTTFNGLRLLISIPNRENALQICLEAIWWSHFLSWDSSSKMNLAHIKLTKN